MSIETPTLVTCPQCHQSLPATAVRCQFCGQALTRQGTAPISVPGVKIHDANYRKQNAWSWKDWGYIICSCLIVLGGVIDLLIGTAVIPTMAVIKGGGGTFFNVIGTVEVGMGVALLAQQTWAQFIMKWVCILGILNAVRNIFFGFLLATAMPLPGLMIFDSVLKLVVYSFTLYFILDMADV